ncbi:MAG: FMN-binding negative transcriptional regulator [Gammaproteobacteria bacterium]|nr:FMN-binding negative transcriptional regulator [Gammaproteobacteria bacterium]NVK88255.1 FMN-binding negative transcriptional regulator [Gammaproteobacteria bacterium]
MYIPEQLALTDSKVIGEIIAAHGFGLLLTSDLTATHLPLVHSAEGAELGTLYGHFAKTNSHWQQAQNQSVLVVFQGPHAYISPRWYQRQPAVPTWNYVAVHCYGKLELLADNENHTAMNQLVEQYEPELLTSTAVMPEDYQARLRQNVVGFKIVIDKVDAKEKLGQHRVQADQRAVHQALEQHHSPEAQALARYMTKRQLGTGS